MVKRKRRTFTPEFKAEVVLGPSAVKVHKRSCGVLRHNLNEDQLSKWKQQFLENAAAVLPPWISNPVKLRSGSHTLSTSLGC